MYTNANLFMLAPTPAPMASSAYYYATGNSSLYNKDRPVPTMSVPIPSHPALMMKTVTTLSTVML